ATVNADLAYMPSGAKRVSISVVDAQLPDTQKLVIQIDPSIHDLPAVALTDTIKEDGRLVRRIRLDSLSTATRKTAVLHELGHLIGFAGHNPQPGLMAASPLNIPDFTPAEK